MKKEIAGLFLVIAGLYLIFIQSSSITGAVVGVSDIVFKGISFLGLLFIAVGVILLVSSLEERVEVKKTDRFEKDIRGANMRAIQRAIAKIGTDLGNEKSLRYGLKSHYSVRVDKGGRIWYKREPNNSIVLTHYVPSSRHR